jgi:hypothetical protein
MQAAPSSTHSAPKTYTYTYTTTYTYTKPVYNAPTYSSYYVNPIVVVGPSYYYNPYYS